MSYLEHFLKYTYFFINLSVIYTKLRWSVTLFLMIIYIWSVYSHSYDAFTYLIGLYMIQLSISFFTPKGLEQDEDPQTISIQRNQLIQKSMQNNLESEYHEQYRKIQEILFSQDKPLVRQLGEYEIWIRITIVMVIALICTRFKSLQIDLFWPVLLIYFVALILYTFAKIIKKMLKYNYTFANFTQKLTFCETQAFTI